MSVSQEMLPVAVGVALRTLPAPLASAVPGREVRLRSSAGRQEISKDMERLSSKGNRSTQFVVRVSETEKRFILDAAAKDKSASLSIFAREIVLAEAKRILGHDSDLSNAGTSITQPKAVEVLNAYLDAGRPAGLIDPVAIFPSIPNFAAMLSDRNRELLSWLDENEGMSIHEVSQKFEYSYPFLSRTLRNLAATGIIGYDPIADARCNSPRLLCRTLRLHLPLRQAAAGKEKVFRFILGCPNETEPPNVTCSRMRDFTDVISDSAYRLLRLMAAHKPSTIGDLGKLTGKTSQNVYPLLRKLKAAGIVKVTGNNRKKHAALKFDVITLDVNFVGSVIST